MQHENLVRVKLSWKGINFKQIDLNIYLFEDIYF